jgi:hypothetical protein
MYNPLKGDLTASDGAVSHFYADYDRVQHLVMFRHSGFWTPMEAPAWLDIATRIRQEAERDGPYDILTDLLGGAPQTPAVARAIEENAISMDSALVRRNAIITESAIVRMQIRRQVGGAWDVAFFDTVEAGLAWIRQG